MWVVMLGIAGAAAVFLFFRLLQLLSDRTYKPTPEEVTRILQASLEGRLDLGTLDEFACVRIAYDSRLDRIRERFNAIVDDAECVTHDASTSQSMTPLTETGRSKIEELLREVRELSIRTNR